MSHKPSCAVFDPTPDTCDCGYREHVLHAPCRRKIEELEAQLAASQAMGWPKAKERIEELELSNRQLDAECKLLAKSLLTSGGNVDRMTAAITALKVRVIVLGEMPVINTTYDRIRKERVFAVDDLEYDLFSAGWREAVALLSSALNEVET